MSVAYPWMLAFPAPTMSHSLWGFPVFEFSHAISLAAVGPHGTKGSGNWAAGLARFVALLPGRAEAKTAFVELVSGIRPAIVFPGEESDAIVLRPGLTDT